MLVDSIQSHMTFGNSSYCLNKVHMGDMAKNDIKLPKMCQKHAQIAKYNFNGPSHVAKILLLATHRGF